MKIAALLVPGFGNVGGVPRAAHFMSYALKQSGYNVTVFDLATSRVAPQSSRIAAPKTWFVNPQNVPDVSEAKLYHCGSHLAEVEPLRYMPRKKLTKILNSFDLVQLVAGTPAWANILRDVQSPRVLLVATTTQWERESQDRVGSWSIRTYRRAMTKIANSLDKRGVRLVDHVLAINTEMESWAASARGRSNDVSLIPPAIDTAFFRPNRGWSSTGPLISVGRLAETRKGWDRLLRGYAHALRDFPDLPDLHLVGKGDLSSRDFMLMTDLGLLEKVRIMRDVTEAQLLSELQAGSVFVQMSHEEGLGLGALEAMACGLPVIATDTFGSREYVNSDTGILLNQDDATLNVQFTKALNQLLDGAGRGLSLNSRKFVKERFGLQTTVKKTSEIFTHCVTND